MSRKSQRIISINILIAMLISFSACDKETVDETENSAIEVETQPETTADDLYPYQEGTYDGAEFNFLITRSNYAGQDYNDVWVEEDSADPLEAAVFLRNASVEERHNIKISADYVPEAAAEMRNLVTAGDQTYEAMQAQMRETLPLATNGLLYNINEIDTIYLEAPWYSEKLMKSASIAGKLNVIGGDITVSDKNGIAVLSFNKNIIAEHNIPDIYSTVRNGEWTLDTLQTYTEITSIDLNGDGMMEKKYDQFGFMAEPLYGWFLIVAGGGKIAEKDANDIPYLTVYNEGGINLIEKTMDLMYNKDTAIGPGMLIEEYNMAFTENRAVFHANVLSTFCMYREMEADFGFVPLPKYTAEQKEYITTFSPAVSRFISIPISNTDISMTGVIIDAMSRTSDIEQMYYDIMLNGKTVRDEESAEMLDIIIPSVVCDIGACYNWNNIWINLYNNLYLNYDRDFSSAWRKLEEATQNAMNETIQHYLGEEQ